MDKTDLFQSGQGGYVLYHIPGIVVTGRGTILATCEGRHGNGSDWAPTDVLLRRSTDGGKTWSVAQKIAQVPGPFPKHPLALEQKLAHPETEATYHNPVAIADRDDGVHMIFCLEYMRCFYLHSSDDGLTWSTPVEITRAFDGFKKAYPWAVLATGPGHGIQLKSGRLVVPVWISTGQGGNAHRPSVVATIYSDDEGKTWHAGDIAAPDTKEWVNPSESEAVELTDGRVMLNMRNESREGRRLSVISPDGATNWSAPTFQDKLLEPICMGSIARYSVASSADRNRLIFSNPDNLTQADGKRAPGQKAPRQNLSIKMSYDEGATWPVTKPLEPGPSNYSDLAVLPDGTMLCFYGRGMTDGDFHRSGLLTIARFNLEWLTDGKDSFHPPASK